MNAVLVSLPVAVLKHSDKSNLLHSLIYLTVLRKSKWQELERPGHATSRAESNEKFMLVLGPKFPFMWLRISCLGNGTAHN